MARTPWKYNSFCLVSFSAGKRRITIPIPLSLVQDLVESVCWILYWLVKLSSGSKIQARINEKLPFNFKSRELMRMLKLPHWFFTELRYCGSMVLVRVRDDNFFMEIRLV